MRTGFPRFLTAGLGLLAGLAAVLSLFSQGRRTAEIVAPRAQSFRILLGVGDQEPASWDGSVSLTAGRILSIRGWRFSGEDSTDYRSSWKASTRHGAPRAAGARKKGAAARGPMQDNGVIIAAALRGPGARFDVSTAQGAFTFTADETPYGEVRPMLDGRVLVERVPTTVQLTTSDEEQDCPAIAAGADEIYVAFVDFVHGDRARASRQLTEAPQDFAFLARPVGGDQVRLLRYSRAKRIWSAPEDVSAPKQDLMRTAVAVDGSGRVWTIWSANRNGNFDLYARAWSRGGWSNEIRITTDAGPDLNPVAVTDSKGRVWLAWQGFRKDNLEILAAVQNGDRFGREVVVSSSTASDWDPAIAASAAGEVAVSWDTYDKGDYDVYLRGLRYDGAVRMDAPVAVAASENFEARSSIAYGPNNRLWVAYEAASVKWGKDFGAYETTGVALYQGHNIRLKCFDGAKEFTTAEELASVLPGPAGDERGRRRGRRAPGTSAAWPDPEAAGKRVPSATPQPPPLARNSFPRLAVDPAGIVYLAYRTSNGDHSPAGTVWHQQVVYFDGAKWRGPVMIPYSDTLLDSRPALAGLDGGGLMAIVTSDHRQSAAPGGRRRGGDGVNADLYAAEIPLDLKPAPARLSALPVERPAAPSAEAKAELGQVRMMRNYRAKVAGGTFQLLRGEFHRHTEISGDGGRDGPVIDAYRYMIDAAYMDWGGCCDHDNGGGREYFWWIEQKLTDAYKMGARFVPMFSYERSVRYPEGHRNVVFPQRGIRPLPRLPLTAEDSPPTPAPDTQMLYRYLRQFGGIVASHTSGTNMGTDWRDNDPVVEPVVEIYQGDRQNYEMPEAPRSNSAGDSIGGWRPLGFVSLALQKGYRLGFQASSDHISTHMSYCNLWVTAPTREAIMEAFHKRRVYGATDNILADVRCGEHFMGEEFTVSAPPRIQVKLAGAAELAKVHVIKDGRYVYTTEPKTRAVEFSWTDSGAEKGKASYYYVRGEQTDGELVWVSPMWIAYN